MVRKIQLPNNPMLLLLLQKYYTTPIRPHEKRIFKKAQDLGYITDYFPSQLTELGEKQLNILKKDIK